METRAHHILIGLFVLLAFLGAMAFGLWLSKSQDGDHARYYRIAFNEAVRGLSIGSAVEYNGINVGDVVRLTLDPSDPRRVLARVRVRGDIIVRQDTSAALAMQGITGTSVIQLSGGSPDSAPLESPDDEHDPLIIATPSPVSRMLLQGENTFANLNELLISGKQVLSPENIENLRRTLENLETLTEALTSQGSRVTESLDAIRTAANQASQTFQRLTDLAGKAQTSLEGPAASIMRNLDTSSASLADIAGRVDGLLRDQYGALRSGLQGAGAIEPTLRELRETLASVRSAVDQLNEDPAGYLLDRNTLQEIQP